jgi:hypothetical protein
MKAMITNSTIRERVTGLPGASTAEGTSIEDTEDPEPSEDTDMVSADDPVTPSDDEGAATEDPGVPEKVASSRGSARAVASRGPAGGRIVPSPTATREGEAAVSDEDCPEVDRAPDPEEDLRLVSGANDWPLGGRISAMS